MRDTILKTIFRLILLSVIVGFAYCSFLYIKKRTADAQELTLNQLQAGKAKGFGRITLTGGGLCAWHILDNSQDAGGEPQSYFVAYVKELDMPAIEDSEPDYPLPMLVLIRMTPAEFRMRYSQPVGRDDFFKPAEFTGVIQTYKDVPVRQYFQLSKDYGLPPSEILFFEPHETPKDEARALAGMIVLGILSLPAALFLLSSFVPPRDPVPSANLHLLKDGQE